MRETELHLDALAQTESVFALSNGHIGLRGNLDEGEPYGLPGHLPERLLRGRGRCPTPRRLRLPRGRPDDRQRDQRQADPPARRRRAVRRPLRRAAPPRARARPARRRAAPRRPSGSRRRAPRSACTSTRLVSFTQRAIAAIAVRGRAARRPAPRRRAVRAGRQRAAAAAPTATRARRRRSPRRCVSEMHVATTTPRACSCTRPRASGLRMAAAMDHVVDGPERHRDGDREPRRTSARLTVDRRRSRRASRCGSSSSSPTAGRASARCRRCATRSAPRSPRRGTPAGTGCSPSSARTSTTSGTRADVELDGDAELQQAVRFALFHVAAGGRARRAAGDPGQGADRPRLRRPHVLGHRDSSCCRC